MTGLRPQPFEPRRRLAELAFEWDRRIHRRQVAANAVRINAATNVQLRSLAAWLNENEPTMLAEALDGAGIGC